jgi:hypothetical protein
MRRLLSFFVVAILCAAPARAEWRRAESSNFIVFSEESEARLRERVTLLEHFDRLLRLITSVDDPAAPNKLHVYIVSGADELRAIRPVPPGIAGYYAASPYGIAAVVDRLAGGTDRAARERAAEEILLHEYSHHFMMQYRANAYPAWYVEGFAEYFATAAFRDRSIDIGNFSPGRAYSIVQGQWLPIERVLFGTTDGLGREQMSQFYAQSWLLVHYFYSTPERQAALRRYLVAAREGDPAAQVERATGLTPARLNEELRRYIRGGQIRYRRLHLDEGQAPPAISVTRLPAAADQLMLFEATLRFGVGEEEGRPLLERIRAAAARHPNDAFAQRVLAHAESLFGDGAAADRLLDPLMAAAPADAELMYYKGLRHLRAAREADDAEEDGRAARTWFTRAHRANENHYQTLYRYAEAMRGQPGYVSENTENVLLLAHQLAPQVAEITVNTAIMLINRRHFAEAEALLRPLAADPHNAGVAAAAKELMARARADSTGRAPAPEASD